MTVHAVRLNHAVLFVADLERSLAFYEEAFGMQVVAREPRANAAFLRLPRSGKVFISIKDADKQALVEPARKLLGAGFEIVATHRTAAFFKEHGVSATPINKVKEGRPHIVDAIKSNEIAMVFNTTFGVESIQDSFSIRRTTLMNNVAYFTTVAGMCAAVDGILAMQRETLDVTPLQEYHPTVG